MAYVEPARFEEKEVVLLYVAGATGEAQGVESTLTEAGIDYTLQSEPFVRLGLLGGTELPGVGFYVLSGQADFCRTLLQSHRFTAGLVGGEAS